jgi:hypothetical protein
MDTPTTHKTCKLCCMQIPQQARKCPHCLHYQNRWSLIVFHPVFAFLLFSVPTIALMAAFTKMLSPGENYEAYKNQIVVTDSQIAFGDTKSSGTVAVIGTIKNKSHVPWKEVHFHVDFLDAAGKRVDVGEREADYFRLPADETSSFKVSFRREFAETNYVKPVVSVSGAKDARSRW